MISFDSALRMPKNVLLRELDGEAVLLNLDTEYYFGLDRVGTRIFTVLTTARSIREGLEKLLQEYDVADEKLRHDVADLIEKLMQHGLVLAADSNAG